MTILQQEMGRIRREHGCFVMSVCFLGWLMSPEYWYKARRHGECCDEPRGFVGDTCDNCGGIVQPDPDNKER